MFDKFVYSAFADGSSPATCRAKRSTLLVSGAETDVCVLATVLAAVDHGYRVVLITDAIAAPRTGTVIDPHVRQPLRRPIELASTEEALRVLKGSPRQPVPRGTRICHRAGCVLQRRTERKEREMGFASYAIIATDTG